MSIKRSLLRNLFKDKPGSSAELTLSFRKIETGKRFLIWKLKRGASGKSPYKCTWFKHHVKYEDGAYADPAVPYYSSRYQIALQIHVHGGRRTFWNFQSQMLPGKWHLKFRWICDVTLHESARYWRAESSTFLPGWGEPLYLIHMAPRRRKIYSNFKCFLSFYFATGLGAESNSRMQRRLEAYVCG